MNGKKFLVGIGIAAFASLVTWAVTSVPEAPKVQNETSDSKVMSYDGNTISEEKDGHKIWELTAEHIEIDTDSKDVKLEKLQGYFYAKDGRVVSVNADNGSYSNATKDIALTGNVSIENSDGAKLTSDELKWTAKDEVLAAVGSAVAVKDDMRATGDTIESTDGFNKIKIIGHANLSKGGAGN